MNGTRKKQRGGFATPITRATLEASFTMIGLNFAPYDPKSKLPHVGLMKTTPDTSEVKLFKLTKVNNYIESSLDNKPLSKIEEVIVAFWFYQQKYNLTKLRVNEIFDTFITQADLDAVKKQLDFKCTGKEMFDDAGTRIESPACVYRFMKAYADKFKVNIITLSYEGSDIQDITIKTQDATNTLLVYFVYDIDKDGKFKEEDYDGTRNIVNREGISNVQSFIAERLKKSDLSPGKGKEKGQHNDSESDDSESEDSDAREREAQLSAAREREAQLSAAREREAQLSAAREGREREAHRLKDNPAKTQPPSPDDVVKTRHNIVPNVTYVDDFHGIDAANKTFTDAQILVDDTIEPYKQKKTVSQRYTESKNMNIFKTIVPNYLDKCKKLMGRFGLQIIFITPHISTIIAKLGFIKPTPTPVIDQIKTFANEAQLRTALQLRNLLARIQLYEKNDAGTKLAQEVSNVAGNENTYVQVSRHSICTLNLKHVFNNVLGKPTHPQTVLMGVHRNETKWQTHQPQRQTKRKRQTEQAITQRLPMDKIKDKITSLITYKPSFLKVDGNVTNLQGDDRDILTDLWKDGKLAFIDIACAPSAATTNPFLSYQDKHQLLLMLYTFLNILKECAKNERKYTGICTKLIAQELLKIDGDEKEDKFMLKNTLIKLGFKEYTVEGDDSDLKSEEEDEDEEEEPEHVTYLAIYESPGMDESVFVKFIETIDTMLDDIATPYMTELCNGGVCR